MYNNRLRRRVKRATKSFELAVKEKKVNEAKNNLSLVQKVLDKAAKKNVIKKENAARRKSRLAQKLNRLTA